MPKVPGYGGVYRWQAPRTSPRSCVFIPVCLGRQGGRATKAEREPPSGGPRSHRAIAVARAQRRCSRPVPRSDARAGAAAIPRKAITGPHLAWFPEHRGRRAAYPTPEGVGRSVAHGVRDLLYAGPRRTRTINERWWIESIRSAPGAQIAPLRVVHNLPTSPQVQQPYHAQPSIQSGEQHRIAAGSHPVQGQQHLFGREHTGPAKHLAAHRIDHPQLLHP